jgi:hypothetical protein
MAQFGLDICTVPGTKTHYSQAHGVWTTLDLVIASQAIGNSIIKCTSNLEDGHGSDHRTIELSLDLQLLTKPTQERLNYHATNWEDFVEVAAPKLRLLADRLGDNPNVETIDDVADQVTSILEEATKDHTPTSKPCPHSKRWWTSALTGLRNALTKAQRLFNR